MNAVIANIGPTFVPGRSPEGRSAKFREEQEMVSRLWDAKREGSLQVAAHGQGQGRQVGRGPAIRGGSGKLLLVEEGLDSEGHDN